MKKRILQPTYLILLFLFVGAKLFAQSPVTVGEDTQSVSAPLALSYNHSYTQTIYLKSELTRLEGKPITQIAYQIKEAREILENIEVYIGYTTKNAFEGENITDWVDLSSLEKYYDKKITFAEDGWTELELNAPFIYDSSKGNLVIAVNTPQKRIWWQSISFNGTEDPNSRKRVLIYRNDNVPFSLTSPQKPGSSSTVFPNIKFYYRASGPELTLETNALDFGAIQESETPTPITKSVTVKNTGSQALVISGISAINLPFSTSFTGATLEPMEEINVEFTFNTATLGSFEQDVTFTSNAENQNTLLKLTGEVFVIGSRPLVIGLEENPAKTNYVPFSLLQNYSHSQVIYLSSELQNIVGMQINKLGYQLYRRMAFSNPINEDITLYIGYTDKTSFSSRQDWESEDNLVECFRGKFVLKDEAPHWGEIELDRPFVYDGSKNLVIAVAAPKKREWTQNLNFYASTVEANRALMFTHNSEPFNPTAPQAGSLLSTVPNTRFYYNVLPNGAVLKLKSDEIDFDYLEVGKTVTYNLLIRNNGTENLILTGIDQINPPFVTDFTGGLTIEPYKNAEVAFSFSPTEAGDFKQDAISFVHNAVAHESFSLKGKAYSQGSLLESFEDNILPPNLWRSKTNKWTFGKDAYHGSYAANLGTTNDTLITPLVSGNFSLYAKQQGTSGKIKILYSNDLITWTEVLEETSLTDDFVEYNVNIPSSSFVGITGTNVIVDLVKAQEVTFPSIDLLISSWSVEGGLKENTNTQIPVTVKNWGVSAETDYDLHLKNGETGDILLTVKGESIEPFTEKTITLEWNPQPNVNSIYAEVELAGDEDATNNKSFVVPVVITPYLGVMEVTPSKELDFGLAKASGEKRDLTVKIKNTGIAQLIITSLELDAPFSTTLKAPASLDVNEERTITITFTPTQPVVSLDTLKIFHDGVDGMTEIPLRGELIKKGDLYEDFESVDFPPFMWSKVGNGWARKTNPVHEGKAAAYLNSSSVPDTIITPRLNVKAGDAISFYARHWTGSSSLAKMFLSVMVSSDMLSWTTLNTYTQDDLTTTFKKLSVELPTAGEFYVAFVAQTEVIIDLVRGPQVIYPEHDLAVRALNGPSEGSVNGELVYTLSIANQGTTDEENYQIKLVNGEEVLKTIDGVLVPNLEQMDVQIPWTPRAAGDYSLRVIVDSQLDENIDNNVSVPLEVSVVPENSKQVGVGTVSDATIQSDVPIARNWKYSLSETLYLSDELNIRNGSSISEVGYKFYFGSSKVDVTTPVRVWVGETTLTDFSSNLVQVTDLTLVYDSDFTFLYKPEDKFSNPATAWFKFNSDYVYKGGNLVVVVEVDRISLGTASPYINFYENESSNKPRTLYYKADSNPINPEELISLDKMTKKPNGTFPVTLFKYELPAIKVFGSLQDENEVPFGDASVRLISENIEYATTSDENGNFSFSVFASEREYALTVEKEGFDTYTESVNVQNQDVDLGVVVMSEPSENTIFTLLVTSAMEVSLEGTLVELENVATGMIYKKNLPADGKIEYGAIKKGHYVLSIHKENHMPYVNDNLILDKNKMTFQVELKENVVTPYGLLTDVTYSEETGKGIVALSWNNDVDAFYDDFENHEDFDIAFAPWTGIDLDNNLPMRMDIEFKNSTEKQYAIIFNPLNTSPPRWGFSEMMPYEGYKCVAFIRAQNIPNNDWLIAPLKMINEGDIVSFMAKGLGVNFPTENFRVGVSTKSNTDINDFTIISEGNNESVGAQWTQFTYDLSAYVGQEVYIAINYTSVFKQMMFVDNFYIGRSLTSDTPKKARRVISKEKQDAYPEYVIYLDGNEKARVKDTYYVLNEMDGGEHEIAVKAIYKTVETQPVKTTVQIDDLSNFAKIAVNIDTDNNKSADGAKVNIYNSDSNILYEKIVAEGKIEIQFARKGNYILTISLEGYEEFSNEFNLSESKVLDVKLAELKGEPYNLTIDMTKNEKNLYDAEFKWNQELGWFDGFESYTDFSSTISPWTVHDYDNIAPYKLNVMINGTARDVVFPGYGTSSTPMIFNPSTTSPAIDQLEAAYAPEGSKYVAFFSACLQPSNDWLISPKLAVKDDYVFRFMIKAYEVMGLADLSEVMDICISETDTKISSFVVNSTVNPTNKQWTIMEIDLSKYAGKEIHIGFHYKTVDGFIVQLDGIYVGPSTSNVPIGDPIEYEVYLDGNLKQKVKENKYVFTDLQPETTYKAGVKAVYASGTTEMVEKEFTTDKTSGVDNTISGKFNVNPTLVTNGHFTVNSLETISKLHVYDVSGQLVKSFDVGNQNNYVVDVSGMTEGVYYVKVNPAHNPTVEKIIIKR